MSGSEKQMGNEVRDLCEMVMTGVARTVASSGKRIADYDQAAQVMKDEIKALLFGDEYRNEREVIRNRTMHPQYVIASVIASCLLKIKLE